MASIPTPVKLGPWQKVTPTNAAGEANSDAAPQIVVPTLARTAADALNADIAVQTLIELRVISTVLAAGLNVTDDLDTLRQDESARLSA